MTSLYSVLISQEQVCELYQNLHATNSPELLAQFENVILAVIKDIRQHQHDSEQLETTLKKSVSKLNYIEDFLVIKIRE